jgi:hypothetical protein
MNLGSLFTGIGDAGSQVATAKIDAHRQRLDDILESLQTDEAGARLDELKERARRLKLEPDTEEGKTTAQIATAEKVLGRKLTDLEKQMILGLGKEKAASPTDDETIAEIEKKLGRKMTEEEIQRYFKIAPTAKPATPKVVQKATYDPGGHLRNASIDPQTQEVMAWGGIIPEREAFHYIKDDVTGEIQAVRMPTFRKVEPGEIRMSEQAQKQWEQIAPPSLPKTSKAKPSGGGGAAASGGAATGGKNVIARVTPKYTVPLNTALKDAQQKYTTWVTSMRNSEHHTPKTDLSIVFSAVRAQVQGAGRMTNVELERELKAGSFGDRARRWWEQATSGTLPDDQREDLLTVIRNAWAGSAQTAREQWESDRSGIDMPTYIKDDDLSDLTSKVKH